MPRQFFPIEAFANSNTGYKLLPFKFIRLNSTKEVLVNEVGEFVIVPSGTAQRVIRKQLSCDSDLFSTLKAKQFLFEEASPPLLDLLATKYRTKHSFLEGFTKLHIVVVTLRCDHSCHYCQVSRQTADKKRYDMSPEVAEKSVELMMRSPSRHITMELQGGEPLLAFDAIKHIVTIAKRRAKVANKQMQIVVTTNLANATDEILCYLRDEGIKISTSLDGPAFIHNANRPRPGNDSYELTVRNIDRARKILGFDQVAALMTTTQLSLQHPTEIIDEYVRREFHSIFLRPLSPYGFAVRTRRHTGYRLENFLDFYKTGLAHILEINRRGYDLEEVYTKILLTKILTPYGTGYVDLQSPAGAGISVLVYNYDGDVYATDESRMLAEMGDHTFRLGNVLSNTYEDIFTGEPFLNILSASCNQSINGCSDCAFQTYCGADPVFNYATQGDIFGDRPSSSFCHRNMEIIKHLFEMISSADAELMRIFLAWVQTRNLRDLKMRAPA
jgi:His-Xaa-Ser system radical SAM maturase HxsB